MRKVAATVHIICAGVLVVAFAMPQTGGLASETTPQGTWVEARAHSWRWRETTHISSLAATRDAGLELN